MGKLRFYDQIMDAVSNFDMANAQLSSIVNALAAEEI